MKIIVFISCLLTLCGAALADDWQVTRSPESKKLYVYQRTIKDQDSFDRSIDQAIRSEDTLGLQALLKNFRKTYKVDPNGKHWLQIAVQADSAAMVKALLALNADPDLPDADGNAPIHKAVGQLKTKALAALLNNPKTDVNLPNKGGDAC